MKIAVHVNEDELFDKKWIEFIAQKGVEVLPVDMMRSDILNLVKECDGVMWHFHHSPLDKQVASKILPVIEEVLNIPVWPNYHTRWHFDEKIAQHYLLQALGVPSVKSWVFWNYEEAKKFIENDALFPLVFKLSVGAGAANVMKVDSQKEAFKLLEEMFCTGIFPYSVNEYAEKSNIRTKLDNTYKYLFRGIQFPLPGYYQVQKDYIYFQKFLPGNDNDVRITVIGDRAFGFIRYNRDGDFRASGSGKIDVDPANIPIEAVKVAHEVSRKNGFQSMAYDFLRDEKGEYLINEISYGYADWAVYDCPGYWDCNLNWHEGHVWPEEAQIDDFIRYISSMGRT